VSAIENERLQAFGAVQPPVNACLHAPDLGLDIQFFLIVVIGSDEVSNSQAAIQVFAHNITQAMAPTAAFAGHGEHGGPSTGMNVMAERAHMDASTIAAESKPSEFYTFQMPVLRAEQ